MVRAQSKSTIESIKAALAMLTRRDKVILLLVILSQAFLGFVDLVAITTLGLVVGIAISVVTGGAPGIVTVILEKLGLGNSDPLTITLWLASIAAFLLVAKSIASFFVTRRAFKFLANRQALVSGRLASLMLQRPLFYLQKRSSQQNSLALTAGVSAAMLGIVGQLVVILSEIALLTVLSIGLFVISPFVSLFTFGFFAFVAFLIHYFTSRRAERLGKIAMETDVASITTVQNLLRSFREVFVSGRRSIYVRNFQLSRWTASKVQADTYILSQIPKYIFDIALVIGGALLIGFQIITVDLSNAIAITAIFFLAASRIMPALLRIQGAVIDMKHATGQAEVTFDVATELHDRPGWNGHESTEYLASVSLIKSGLQLGYPDFEATVELKGVSFRYPEADQLSVNGISLSVSAGTSLALTGSTGAGKSTLADIMLGVLAPEAGSVEVGGCSPAEALAKWPGGISYIPQDIVVISGSIRENVAFGLPPELVDDTKIWESLEMAQLAQFIRTERDGLETRVGEHGAKLSGGQRQRLGIARALYTSPKLLLLDEATSALDAETENAITETLQSLSGTVTQIIVAHRLATIRHCTQVAYLQEGKLIGLGEFDAVRKSSNVFDRQAKLLGL